MKHALLLLLAISGTFLAAQADFQLTQNGQAISVAERMAQDQTQGLSMVILLDGAPILHEQWGYRDAAAELPVTPATVFQIGSMSQPVTQFAIMQLVDAGILNLDTDVNTYLTSWQLPVNKITRANPVTLRDLCLQRRGFKFPYKPDGYTAGATLPTHLQLLNGEKPARNPAVTLKADLNKSGDNSYAPSLILQQVLMDHYQLPFPELMAQHVFAPLGMNHSYFAAEPTTAQRTDFALGYDDKNQVLKDGFLRFPELAASGMYTTAYDYALFVQALLDAIAGKADVVISQALAREILLPENPEDTLLFNRGDSIFSWGGATPGFYTQFDADAVDQRWVVVALTNDNINWRLNGELRRQGADFARQQIAKKTTNSEHDE